MSNMTPESRPRHWKDSVRVQQHLSPLSLRELSKEAQEGVFLDVVEKVLASGYRTSMESQAIDFFSSAGIDNGSLVNLSELLSSNRISQEKLDRFLNIALGDDTSPSQPSIQDAARSFAQSPSAGTPPTDTPDTPDTPVNTPVYVAANPSPSPAAVPTGEGQHTRPTVSAPPPTERGTPENPISRHDPSVLAFHPTAPVSTEASASTRIANDPSKRLSQVPERGAKGRLHYPEDMELADTFREAFVNDILPLLQKAGPKSDLFLSDLYNGSVPPEASPRLSGIKFDLSHIQDMLRFSGRHKEVVDEETGETTISYPDLKNYNPNALEYGSAGYTGGYYQKKELTPWEAVKQSASGIAEGMVGISPDFEPSSMRLKLPGMDESVILEGDLFKSTVSAATALGTGLLSPASIPAKGALKKTAAYTQRAIRSGLAEGTGASLEVVTDDGWREGIETGGLQFVMDRAAGKIGRMAGDARRVRSEAELAIREPRAITDQSFVDPAKPEPLTLFGGSGDRGWGRWLRYTSPSKLTKGERARILGPYQDPPFIGPVKEIPTWRNLWTRAFTPKMSGSTSIPYLGRSTEATPEQLELFRAHFGDAPTAPPTAQPRSGVVRSLFLGPPTDPTSSLLTSRESQFLRNVLDDVTAASERIGLSSSDVMSARRAAAQQAKEGALPGSTAQRTAWEGTGMAPRSSMLPAEGESAFSPQRMWTAEGGTITKVPGKTPKEALDQMFPGDKPGALRPPKPTRSLSEYPPEARQTPEYRMQLNRLQNVGWLAQNKYSADALIRGFYSGRKGGIDPDDLEFGSHPQSPAMTSPGAKSFREKSRRKEAAREGVAEEVVPVTSEIDQRGRVLLDLEKDLSRLKHGELYEVVQTFPGLRTEILESALKRAPETKEGRRAAARAAKEATSPKEFAKKFGVLMDERGNFTLEFDPKQLKRPEMVQGILSRIDRAYHYTPKDYEDILFVGEHQIPKYRPLEEFGTDPDLPKVPAVDPKGKPVIDPETGKQKMVPQRTYKRGPQGKGTSGPYTVQKLADEEKERFTRQAIEDAPGVTQRAGWKTRRENKAIELRRVQHLIDEVRQGAFGFDPKLQSAFFRLLEKHGRRNVDDVIKKITDRYKTRPSGLTPEEMLESQTKKYGPEETRRIKAKTSRDVKKAKERDKKESSRESSKKYRDKQRKLRSFGSPSQPWDPEATRTQEDVYEAFQDPKKSKKPKKTKKTKKTKKRR